MESFAAFCRRYWANRVLRGLFITLVIYFFYLLYIGTNYLVVSDGLKDPIYQIFGVDRSDQLTSVSLVFGIVVMVLLSRLMVRGEQRLDFRSSTATKRGTTLLVALIFLNGVTTSLAAVLDELSSQFWTPLYAWVALVLVLQLLIVYAALTWVRQSKLHLVLMTALSVFNLFALYASLLGQFQGQPVFIRVSIIVVAMLSFGVLYAAIGKRLLPLRRVNAVLILTMLAPIAGIVLSASAPPQNAERLEPFVDIEFGSKPNIFIVSVDALSPVTLVEKHLGLSDLAYERVLERDGVITFKNAFASQVPTRQSLNSLMRLAHPDFAGDFGYFAGRTDGPVTHILRANGYNISTGFNQLYFGNQGPFVDAYEPDSTRAIRNSTLCALALRSPLKFFGFCELGILFDEPRPRNPWPNRVIAIIQGDAHLPAAKPRFTLHYIINPVGHTTLDYRSSDLDALERYAEVYRNGADRVAVIMEQLYDTVRKDPAASILIVMGDHGPFLSRTVSFDDDPSFVVQDQHGILAAILTNNTGCSAQQLRHYIAEFATPERILASVMRCLARDPARLDTVLRFEEAYEFKKFLYE